MKNIALLSRETVARLRKAGLTDDAIERAAEHAPGGGTVATFSREVGLSQTAVRKLLDDGVSVDTIRRAGKRYSAGKAEFAAQPQTPAQPQKPLTAGRKTVEIFDPRGVSFGGTHTTYEVQR